MKKEIKNIFRESFDVHDTSVDTKALLAGIATKRKPKKEKKLVWWMFSVGLFLMVTIAFIFNSDSLQNQTSLNSDYTNLDNKDHSGSPMAESRKESNSELSTSELSSSTNIESKELPKEKFVGLLSIPEDAKIKSDASYVSRLNDESSLNFDPKKVEEQTAAGKISKPILQNKRASVKKGSMPRTPIKENQLAETISSENDEKSDLSYEINSPVNVVKGELVLEAEPLVAKEIQDTVNKELREDNEEHKPEVKLMNNWSAKLLAGGSLSFISQVNASQQSALGQGFGLSGALQVYYGVFKDIYLGVGISGEKYIQKFEWSGQYVVDRNDDFVDKELTLDYVSEDYLFTIREREILKYNNRFFLDLPVSLSFRKNVGSMVFEPTIFVAFNLLNSQEGYMLNGDGIPQSLSTKKHSLGPKFGLGLDIEFVLTEKVNFVSRFAFSKRKLDQESISLPELSFGMRYGF